MQQITTYHHNTWTAFWKTPEPEDPQTIPNLPKCKTILHFALSCKPIAMAISTGVALEERLDSSQFIIVHRYVQLCRTNCCRLFLLDSTSTGSPTSRKSARGRIWTRCTLQNCHTVLSLQPLPSCWHLLILIRAGQELCAPSFWLVHHHLLRMGPEALVAYNFVPNPSTCK